MSWDKYTVMSEFEKLAQKEGLLNKSASDQAPAPNPYQEDLDVIVEKRQKSPEKHIMEIAHPKPIYIAESRGDGALVENEIEQQKKTIDIALKTPTGTLVGRYASAINSLVKIANQCDELGYSDAADLITNAVDELLKEVGGGDFFV